MRLRFSFRFQILAFVTLVLVLGFAAGRSFFLDSLVRTQQQLSSEDTQRHLRTIYREFAGHLDSLEQAAFKDSVTTLLRDLRRKDLVSHFFVRDVQLYSWGVLAGLLVIVLVLFLLFFQLLTRPLNRLLRATSQLQQGNFQVTIPESPLSPLNDLIKAFNTMTRELRENRERLLAAEKDLIWRETARVLAHEIKNPLTPIRLAIQRLAHKYQPGDEQFAEVLNESVRVVEEEVSALQELVDSFSQLAKLPAPAPREYDFHRQLRETAAQYQDQAEFHLELTSPTPLIYADPNQMHRLLTNLIQNAIQMAPAKAVITLRSREHHGGILFEVADNGPGIPQEIRDKVFQPYYSTRSKGTGLGLAIVERIFRHHQGQISVECPARGGTVFRIFIPHRSEQDTEAAGKSV